MESYLSQLEDCNEDDLLKKINLSEFEQCDPNDRVDETFNSTQSNELINEDLFTAKLEWSSKIVHGQRFRYQSEIGNKTFSALKSNDGVPSVKVLVNEHSYLRLSLLTVDKQHNHFYSFYTDKPNESNFSFPGDNSVLIPIEPNQNYQIVKLQNIGIKMLTQKEAIPVIRSIYPKFSDNFAKNFFKNYKGIVVVQASILLPQFTKGKRRTVPDIYSDPIKSSAGTENLQININCITPLNITTNEENIIAVLKKKVTNSSNVRAYLDGKGINEKDKFLKERYNNGQTFVYKLPRLCIIEKLELDFIIKNDESSDTVLVTFIPVEGESIESRKRKNVIEDYIALKRPNLISLDSVLDEQTPQTETSENYGNNIELDEVQQPTTSIATRRVTELIEASGCGDSMHHQRSFESEDEDDKNSDNNDNSENETNEEYEMDAKKQNNCLEHIEVPMKPREKVILNPKHNDPAPKNLHNIRFK